MNTDKSIELSLSTLRVLLWGDERLEGITPLSKGVGDTAKVKIVPHGIGRILKEIDKEEEFFHVEIVPCNDKESRPACAEIWLTFEWKESNARRSRQQNASAEQRVFRDKHAGRLREIKDTLAAFGLDKKPGYVDHLAADMLKAYKEGHISKMLTIFNLAEKFQRYEEEDKQS